MSLNGLLSDVRTKLVAGAAIPLYGWRDEPLMIACAAAAFTSQGSYGIRITELTDIPVENLAVVDTLMFTSKTEVRLFRGSFIAGELTIRYERLQSAKNGRIKFSLFRGSDWEPIASTGGRLILNDGPGYPDEILFNRDFVLSSPMDVYLVLVSTYKGAPGGCTIEVE